MTSRLLLKTANISFNSTLVQLKTNAVSDGQSQKRGFNSTLVQLKTRIADRLTMRTVCGFQFHIGSIKNRARSRRRVDLVGFQFHIGSIKKQQISFVLDSYNMFQFHIGSIKNQEAGLILPSNSKVSIPHWFN